MRAPPWCLLRGETRGSLRYSCRTRELIRQAERRARFQARRSACREVRFRRTGCPRSAAPFFGAEGAAKQQNRRKRSVFPQRWRRRAAARPLFFGAEGAAKPQKKRKRSVFSVTATAACGSAPAPRRVRPSFFNAARFFYNNVKRGGGRKKRPRAANISFSARKEKVF